MRLWYFIYLKRYLIHLILDIQEHFKLHEVKFRAFCIFFVRDIVEVATILPINRGDSATERELRDCLYDELNSITLRKYKVTQALSFP